jgi:CMP-N,N'-diacetyllegionaminic acid synthase
MKHLAIITARSGSKGLPDKNIRMLNGHPLMAWSIMAARESDLYDRILLSTDSEQYARIGREYGAETPWLRNSALSGDEVSSSEVIADILIHLQQKGEPYDCFTLLQPTSPLRNAGDLQMAMQLFREKNALSVVGVTLCEHPPQWTGPLPEDLSLDGFITPEFSKPRQQLGEYYRINGAVYIADCKNYLKTRSFFTGNSYACIMPAIRSVDIDTELDFMLAETIFQHYKPAP